MSAVDRARSFRAWRAVVTFQPPLSTEELYERAADRSLPESERACYLAEINRRVDQLLRNR